jgi:arabinose-5-phosphate isomerase
MTESQLIAAGKRVIAVERDALSDICERLDESFARAVELVLGCKGRVIITGIGKSGIIGKKIAATLTSTGTPAFFLHSTEAVHGDMGVLSSDDVVIAISKSGSTEDLAKLLQAVKRLKIPVVALTADGCSHLGKMSDVILDISVKEEACGMNIVPTTSTTVCLAMGDALALTVAEVRGLKPDDFAYFHPAGVIGRRLLLRVRDVMHSGKTLPKVDQNVDMREAVSEIIDKGLGVTAVVDAAGLLVGIITDGDLKRILLKRETIMSAKVGEVMVKNPKTIARDQLVASALKKMEDNPSGPITSLVVVDEEGRPEGIIHIHDCLRAGVT